MPDHQKTIGLLSCPHRKRFDFCLSNYTKNGFLGFLREPTLEVHMSPYMSEYGLGVL